MSVKTMEPLSSAPDSLCIVRLSALGDVTHAVPVLRAIQRQWPATRITWVCAVVEHRLLSLIDGIRFVTLDKKAGWRGYRELRRQLRGEKFDIMVQMQTSARANLAGACVRARIKLGWDKARARDLHHLFMTHVIPPAAKQHQVQGHLAFARALGLDADEPVWDFPVTEASRQHAAERLPGEQRTLLISPCSSHVHRNWLADRYAAVADYAVATHGMRIVLTGGPSEIEKHMGRDIETAMQNNADNLVGQLTLEQLMGLLERADVVLSPDSGPAHMANALGKPVIGLHACTWSIRGGPYHSLDLCIDKFPQAARQFRNKAPEEIRWGTKIEEPGVMALIEVDEVINRLDEAVSRLPR
ncbi:MAG: glycosyltransferase family 9 protein [Gammaproteobacteria bacterium]|nr:glycosyltransferase family 9 protein [Gammaproteobacteria bacterium]MDH4314744.1 glycosyltransferase family 9 protein [Gammaproteobacteria bacterium]MDH5212830.1 glycosyltransferase family 9 protein [Gammaproteobacteria bacterium]MDH5499526.1 glycosyltransferase family 9 protein [Gammaproteobacteria bacterium]